MADVILHTAHQAQVTCVPNRLIDYDMKDANGEFLKVYLYLLRHLQDPNPQFSISDIADALDHTEKDVRRALAYWERVKLLRLEYDAAGQLCGICLTASEPAPGMPGSSASARENMPESPAPARESMSESPAPVRESMSGSLAPARPTYTPEQLNAAASDEAVRMLLVIAEKYLNRHLTSTDIETILYWIDEEQGLGLPVDLAESVIEYCANENHTNIHYINQAALDWHRRGFTTADEARAYAQRFSKTYNAIKGAFGLTSHSLNDEERGYADRWVNEWGFTDELIAEACRRTIATIYKPSFKYADRILEKWHENGVKSPADLSPLDEVHAKEQKKARPRKADGRPAGQFYQYLPGTYDYDAIEEALWEN